MRTVLSIAGFDPSGGAGVLADIKTFAAMNCYGVAAITSLTAQNTTGVFQTFHQTAPVLTAQLEPLLDDFEIAAVKIGMTPSAEQIEVIAETINKYGLSNVVVDPVIRSTSGYDLLKPETLNVMIEKLFPVAHLLTPNLEEVAALTGDQPSNPETMAKAARTISENVSREHEVAVLVKGGHLTEQAVDVLYAQETIHCFTAEHLASRQTHGTGCTLSSAITALLACGLELPIAVKQAKEYVTAAIMSAPNLGKGNGPLNHFYVFDSYTEKL